jgi:hypothetical protein
MQTTHVVLVVTSSLLRWAKPDGAGTRTVEPALQNVG